MSSGRYVATIEVVLKGDNKTGKTAFARRFVLKTYSGWSKDTDYDFYQKEGVNDKKLILAKIHERPREVIAPDIAYLLYDVTNEKSFQQIQKYYDETIKDAKDQNKKVVIVLIGTKADGNAEQEVESKETPPRKITAAQGKELARKLAIPFYEVSAKKDINVDRAFQFGIDEACNNLLAAKKSKEIEASAKALVTIKTRERASHTNNLGETPRDQPTLGMRPQSPA